jgi:hypothetical protein
MVIGLLRSRQEIDEIIFTLEICLKELPAEAHPDHHKRIVALIDELKLQISI